jgi:hypothetical protein
MLDKVLEINDTEMKFDSFEETATWFKKIINLCRQMNYFTVSGWNSSIIIRELDKMLKDISEI